MKRTSNICELNFSYSKNQCILFDVCNIPSVVCEKEEMVQVSVTLRLKQFNQHSISIIITQ